MRPPILALTPVLGATAVVRAPAPAAPAKPSPLPLTFDPGLQWLYAAGETGTVAVFAVGADRTVTELGRGPLAPNAHSVAVDPASHQVYFPLENIGGHPPAGDRPR